MTLKTRILIIGGGPAGYTAALYTSRANLAPIQLLGSQPGGQLMITTDVENYPGFASTIQGPWLMEQMRLQVEHLGVDLRNDTASRLDLSVRPFICETESGITIQTEAVIIATGAQARWLGLPSEEFFRGFGVSACATCDGFFFKNKKVIVMGGGNTAVEEALHLAHHASEVILIHRRNTLRAEKILQDRLFSNPKISVLWEHTIVEMKGNIKPKSLTSIIVENVLSKEQQELFIDGAFIAIGHTPMTSLVKNQLNCDTEGYILTKQGTTETSIPGVFAAGDVQDKIFRQAITAAGQGCMAAIEAEKFLNTK